MKINNVGAKAMATPQICPSFTQHHEEVQNEIIRENQMVQKGKKCLQRSDAFIKTGVGCNKKGLKVNE